MVWSEVGLSDPVKVLAMFNVVGDKGIENRRIPYYVFLLEYPEAADFNYNFDWTPEPSSRDLGRDIGNMLAVGFLGRNTPILTIQESGKQFLSTFEKRVEDLEERIRPSLSKWQYLKLEQLLDKAHEKLVNYRSE